MWLLIYHITYLCNCHEDSVAMISLIQENKDIDFYGRDDYTCTYKDKPNAKLVNMSLHTMWVDCKELKYN